METTEQKSNTKILKIVIAILALIIMVLVWQLIVTKTKVNTFTIEKEKAKTQNTQLQHELDSLLTEHEKIKKEYGNLSGQLSAKDSIILAKADEIQNLIATQADYYRIKKKLDYLRGITQGYVSQIDSLYRVNKVLKDENVEIKGKYEKEQVKTTELTKDKEDLNAKVTLASSLKAYNIKGVPVRSKSGGKKEDVEDKAKRTDRIKVSFTLSENLIAASGTKNIYVRIARPDDKILCVGTGDSYSFDYNGEKIQYSITKSIDYENKAMDITMYWDKTEDFTAGTYVVSVFTDGMLIGESQFALK
jgi:cell division protein FtsB